MSYLKDFQECRSEDRDRIVRQRVKNKAKRQNRKDLRVVKIL